MLHTKHESDSGIQNILVVSEDTNVIALLIANLDLLNGQLFQKSETQNCQGFLSSK